MNTFSATGGASCNINGKTYVGKTITVRNGVVIVDGKAVTDAPDEKSLVFNITVTGAVESMEVTNGTVTVHGNVDSLKTVSGDVTVEQSVTGNVSTVSGDIKIDGELHGNANTVSGDIKSGGKKVAVRKNRDNPY